MRISDGSSDVCSSDLPSVLFLTLGPAAQGLHPVEAVLELFINTVRRLSEFCGVLSALALAAAVLVVCHMVEIGRGSCRERVCQYVSISLVAVSLQKKKVTNELEQ